MDSTLLILAVDPGKFKSVPCWFHASSGEARFRIIRTTPEERRERMRESVVQVVL